MFRRVATYEWLLIVGSFFAVTAWEPHHVVGDDGERVYDIEQLLFHGHLTSSRYSLVEGLFASPLIELGRVVKSSDWLAARFNVAVAVVGLGLAYRATRGRIDAQAFRLFVLVLLVDSYLTDRLHYFGAENLTAALVALGLLAITSGRWSLVGWAAIVIGVVNTPAGLGGLALLCAGRAYTTRRLRPVLALPAALALIGLEAWLRRGSPFDTGYANDHGHGSSLPYSHAAGFHYPFVPGLFGILFSFGRGLVFFMPGLLLWLAPRTRRLVPGRAAVTLMLLFLVGLVLVYSKWWAWFGGTSWGPRFFTFAVIPASLFLAVRLRDVDASVAATAAVLGLFVLSAWVGLMGMLDDRSLFGYCGTVQHDPLCRYAPEVSPLWWPVVHHPRWTGQALALAAWWAVVSSYLVWPLALRLVREAAGRAPALAHGWRV